MSNAVEGGVIDTEAPNEVFDIADVLLVGLGGEQCFEQPSPIRDLPDMPDFHIGRDTTSHDDGLLFAIKIFLMAIGRALPVSITHS